MSSGWAEMTKAENSSSDPKRADYRRLLEDFGASSKTASECVRFLEEKGHSRGQARNAVYRFRRLRGLSSRQGTPRN